MRKQVTGFTLIEVLVTLVITSMLVSILMGSLYYLFRIQESLRNEIEVRESELRARAWFSEILSGCLPVAKGQNSEFQGNSKEISCESVSPLRPKVFISSERITVSLKKRERESTTVLYNQQGKNTEPSVISDLQVLDANFSFIGLDGKEVETWPKNDKSAESLPRLIRLAGKSGDIPIDWLVAIRADPWLEEVRRPPFFMEVSK